MNSVDLTGQILGSCLLQERLASGGFGTVYRAVDRNLGVERAIKVLHPHIATQKGFRDRFLGELRTLASLDHPNIVRVLYAANERGLSGIVMEYVPGRTLRQSLRDRGRLAPEEAVAVLVQAARAVAYSQSRPKPVIHRDLTPENLILRPDGVVKVMDYGVAASIEDPALVAVSKTIVGKPRYMAPEQFEGEVSASADIYALGIILYEALTGFVPFDGANPIQVYRAHVTQTPRPPSEAASGTPRELDHIVLRALAKDPRHRFPDAASLARALEIVQADLSGRPRPPADDILELLRPPSSLAAPRAPTPDEQARVEALYSEGFAFLENRQYTEAARKFDDALVLDPVHFESRRNRRIARVRTLEQQEDAAAKEHRREMEEDLLRIAMSLYMEKRWDEAADMFDRVLVANPDRLEAKRYRYESQERSAAERESRVASAARVNETLARARAALAASQIEAAAAAAVEVLSLDPGNEEARTISRQCSESRTPETEGTRRLEQAVAAQADLRAQAVARTRAGLERFASGDVAAAANEFAEALRLDETREDARRWLDNCGRWLQEAARARAELAKPGNAPGDNERIHPASPALEAVGPETRRYLTEPDLVIDIPAATAVDATPPVPARFPAGTPGPDPAEPRAVVVAPPPAPATDAIPFTGRANTLQVMDRALDEAPRGQGAFLLLKGKPGVGKSRLLEEFTSRNSYRKFLFIRSTCSGDLGDYFGPWKGVALEALRSIESVDLLAWMKIGKRFAPELSRFGDQFRQISLRVGKPPDLTVSDSALRQSVLDLLGAVLERQPLFVSLDSLELADSETLWVLERAAQMTKEKPLVLVGAVSQSRAADTNPWARLASTLRSQKIASEFLVPRLPEDDLRRVLGPMLARAAGRPSPAARAEARIASELVRVTEGDLRQMEKIASHLVATDLVSDEGGMWRLRRKAGLSEEDLVAGLGEALTERFKALNSRQSGVMRWLSLSEEGLAFDVLQDVSGLAQADLYHALHELGTQKLVAEQDERGRRIASITSPSLRSRILAETRVPDRQGMYERAAVAMEKLEKGHPERAAAMSVKGTNADRAVESCLRAADAAMETGRADDARSWLEKADEWLARSRVKGHPAAHAERLGRALLACGLPEPALRAFQNSLALNPAADRLGALRLDMARAHLLLGRRREATDAIALAREKNRDRRDEVVALILHAKLALLSDDIPAAGRHLEAARQQADGAGMAPPMLAALAEFRALSGDAKQAHADASEALERGGAPEAMLTLGRVMLSGGKALAAAARLEEAVDRSTDRMFEADGRALLALCRASAGRGTAAREQSALALQAAAATGSPAVQARAALAASSIELASENPVAARDHAARASQLFDGLGQRSGVARAQLALAEGWTAEGEAARALQHVDLAATGAVLPELAALLPIVRGEALLRTGKLAEARASFHVALEKLGKAWRDDALVGRVYAGLAAVHTANRDREAALRNFARAVKALRDTELALPFSLVRAAWAAFLATAPLTRDDAREGAEVALEAAAVLRDAGAPLAEARAREAAATLQQKSA